jgi:hypothetical protein
MSVEATSSSASAPICLTPTGDDPPKVEDKKSEEKKQLDQSAAAKSDAPATQKRDVVVFAARVTRDGSARDAWVADGKTGMKAGCTGATTVMVGAVALKLGVPVPGAAVLGGVVGSMVGDHCESAGSLIGGKAYDAVTGGPNTITFEKQTIQVDVPAAPAKADAAKPEPAKPASADAPKLPPAASKPASASPAPNASTLPYTPAPASSAWTDPTASYLRPAAAK